MPQRLVAILILCTLTFVLAVSAQQKIYWGDVAPAIVIANPRVDGVTESS